MEQMAGGTLTLLLLGAQVCRLFDYYMCTLAIVNSTANGG